MVGEICWWCHALTTPIPWQDILICSLCGVRADKPRNGRRLRNIDRRLKRVRLITLDGLSLSEIISPG
jgi:hypothetical protein